MIVYLLLNTVNCKGYVGQHIGDSISGRWNQKLEGANSHLEAAKNRYGVEVFSREILGVAHNKEEMDNLERLWILILRTYDGDYGYNMTYGGEGGSPTKVVIEKIKKASNAWWNNLSKEERITQGDRIREGQKTNPGTKMSGKSHTKETKAEMSAKATGRHCSDSTKEKLRRINLGKTRSEESKQKQSTTMKGRGMGITLSETHKESLRKAWKTRLPASKETNQKISLSMKAFKASRKVKRLDEIINCTNEVSRLYNLYTSNIDPTLPSRDDYYFGVLEGLTDYQLELHRILHES